MASVLKEADKQHKTLCMKLCDMIDPNEPAYENFILYLSVSIPGERLSSVQHNPTDVFALMEETGFLKVGKYEALEEALDASGYTDILYLVKNEGECITRPKRKYSYSDGPMAGISNIEAATVSSTELEGASEPKRDIVPVSFEVIKRNLRCLYSDLLEEMDPTHLQKTFIDREILNRRFFEKLQNFRRRERMDRFLDKISDIGSEKAILALVDALRAGGDEDFVEKICHVETVTPHLGETAHVDDSLVKVEDVLKIHAEEGLLSSCPSEVVTEKDVRKVQLKLIQAYESVQIISVNPVSDTAANWKDLEDFYTDLVIEEKREEFAEKGKEIVTSFRQIFMKGDKNVKRIILKALAGQGKSIFCRKLVNTWCFVNKKKLNLTVDARNKSETNCFRDEDEMLRFDVLLYICVGDISDEKTLMDVVYNQFPLHESQDLSHRSHVESLIGQSKDNKVLLILDGLDEMDTSSSFIRQIMQRRLYPYITVLATTRPWNIDKLGLIKHAHIDLVLDIQGFSYENSMLFAKKIFDKYYKDESAIARFKRDISEDFLIQSLIHVPLLLLFMVHVWYEQKSFPQTIHELQMEILNLMANRYREGQVRKHTSKGRQEYDLLKMRSLESKTFILTPKLRNLSLVQHFGDEFLACLCEVANRFLIADAKETSLVFKEEALLELLGQNGLAKLQLALDLGVLSSSDSHAIFTKKICLTFLHKTVQEFLAAINICCREDRCNTFLESLNTLYDVFQNEKIIMFVAGISTSHCQKIFEKIYDICDKDMDTEHHMEALSGLHRNCIREASGEPISLKLHSFCVDSQDEWSVLQSAVVNISSVRTRLKCLKLYGCHFDDTALDLHEYTSLTELSLKDVTMNRKLMLSKCTQLRSLKMTFCILDDAALDFSECNCLTNLSFKDVTMKGKLLLSKCTQLRSLKLAWCKLDDAALDLSVSNCLEYLYLGGETISGKLFLSKCTQLRSLKLICCSLDDATLGLSESNFLTKLTLKKVAVKGKLYLSKYNKLKSLKLTHCRLDDATLDFPESNCLTKISLKNVTKKDILFLSKCTQLRSLKLTRCTLDDATLDLSESTYLEYLSLVDVTMKGKLLLSKCTQLKYLKLVKCAPGEIALDLLKSASDCPKIECPQLNLGDAQLSSDNLEILYDPTIDNVTLCKNGYVMLFSSMSTCTQLHELYLENLDLGDAQLGLNSIEELDHLTVNNVTMCKDGYKMLCNSISMCRELTHLSLKNLDLGDALLSLNRTEELYHLTINNVTMCKDGYVMLCNSISKCTVLTHLSLTNLDLGDALLSLNRIEVLYYLTINNVTLCKEGYVKLCNIISKCTELSHLSLKNLNLGDALLSLNIRELDHLTINNVTMCQHGYVMLCNSISKCSELTHLSLKNLDLGDALLSLNIRELDQLTINNVTMCQDGYVMLCNSISKCTELTHLSLNNLDLGDALLSLNIRELDHLTINNVTMCQDGYVMLCNSISKCTELTHLSLTNLDLGNAMPSLDNLKELELVNVTISSQFVDSIRSSVQHLSSLCFLKSHTENLIIEKAVDNCEKYVVKYARHFIDKEFLCDDYDDDTDDSSDYDYFKKHTLKEHSNM